MSDTDPLPRITCPDCLRTSYHPMDISQGYCGYCHWWTSDPTLAGENPNRTVRTESPPEGEAPVPW
jgi:hypothetical protein